MKQIEKICLILWNHLFALPDKGECSATFMHDMYVINDRECAPLPLCTLFWPWCKASFTKTISQKTSCTSKQGTLIVIKRFLQFDNRYFRIVTRGMAFWRLQRLLMGADRRLIPMSLRAPIHNAGSSQQVLERAGENYLRLHVQRVYLSAFG